ncbi:HAMP domain-containing protein [Halovenus sp. WSH3]|uniref:histidine kinase n=1 Tax=Halovenus carboxidivorans TaxID=2692199 RepID=A0A6B0SXL2_9EURY|nr:HAMP domain-containing protein [Halovenus carboxidivorans]
MVNDKKRTGKYRKKFGAVGLLLLAAVAAASVNLYTNLAPELGSSARQQLLSGLVTIFLILLVGIVFTFAAFIRETLSSLRVLAERARQIEEGELDTELEANRNDEFGEVYRALSSLRDGVKTRDQQLDQSRQDDD